MKKCCMAIAFCFVVMMSASVFALGQEYGLDKEGRPIRIEQGKNVVLEAKVHRAEETGHLWFQDKGLVCVVDPESGKSVAQVRIEDWEECRKVFCITPYGLVILELESDVLAVFSLDGTGLERQQGYSPFYWIDEYRFVFTAVSRDDKIYPAVFEIFTNKGKTDEINVTAVIEPDDKYEYEPIGVTDSECIIRRHSSDGRDDEIRVALPAAG